MKKYIYIDESGDLGFSKKSSKYFILSAFVLESPKTIKKIIKNMRRNKFKKQLKKVTELKASSSSKDVRKYLLEKINAVKNAQIFHIILEKQKVGSLYLIENKDKLYNYVAGKLAEIITFDGIDLDIIVDKSKKKIFQINDFNDYFVSILERNPNNPTCDIFHSNSFSFAGLQFADFIAWSMFQKFEKSNSEYNDIIKVKQKKFFLWEKHRT